MSKAQKIRDALGKLAASEVMPHDQLQEKTGLDDLSVVIGSMLRSGEVIATGKKGERCYRLNPKHTPKRGIDKTLPIKRKKKTRKTTRKPRQGKTLREIRDEYMRHPPLGKLALDQLIAASRLLRTTVAANVEGLENDPLLTGALQNAERAEAMAEAA
jgi:hypothetical protein